MITAAAQARTQRALSSRMRTQVLVCIPRSSWPVVHGFVEKVDSSAVEKAAV
jgi:hypothetical protein